MTVTPGAYLKMRRTAAGLSLRDVARQLQTCPRMAEHVCADHLALIEADAQPASFATIVALRRAFRFDLDVLERLALIHLGLPHDVFEWPRLCRICGCSDNDACAAGLAACHWVADELCSACGPAPAIAAADEARIA